MLKKFFSNEFNHPMKKTALLLSASLLSSFPLLTQAEITKILPIIEQQAQVAGFYQHQVGNTQITALLDGTNFMSPKLFQNTPEKEVHEILKKYAADQAKGVQTSINAFLVNTGKSLVLVDSGAASCFGAHLGSMLSNLKASGYQPEQVDTILLTHLHPDHVCGISQNGVANFPNATVYVSSDEASYWLNPKQAGKLPKEKQAGYLFRALK